MTDKDLTVEELKTHLKAWYSFNATKGDYTPGEHQAYNQIVKLIEDSDKPFKKLKEMGFRPVYKEEK